MRNVYKTVTFKEKNYLLRFFYHKKRRYVIGSDNLSDVLMNDEYTEYVNGRAEDIDQEIFFFVPENLIEAPIGMIKNYVRSQTEIE